MLSPDSAATFFPTCTRSQIPIVLRYWQPSAEDIRQLEADLPAYLPHWASTSPRYRESRGRLLRTYYRQYFGLVMLDGTRVIFVNAVHPLALQGSARDGQAPDWRLSPIQVCDGAMGFWNVEYDPIGRRFRAFGFDGSA